MMAMMLAMVLMMLMMFDDVDDDEDECVAQPVSTVMQQVCPPNLGGVTLAILRVIIGEPIQGLTRVLSAWKHHRRMAHKVKYRVPSITMVTNTSL